MTVCLSDCRRALVGGALLSLSFLFVSAPARAGVITFEDLPEVKSQVPCKSMRRWIAPSQIYATASSSFLGGVRVARSCCSWRRVDAVIGMPRQCLEAVRRLA